MTMSALNWSSFSLTFKLQVQVVHRIVGNVSRMIRVSKSENSLFREGNPIGLEPIFLGALLSQIYKHCNIIMVNTTSSLMLFYFPDTADILLVYMGLYIKLSPI